MTPALTEEQIADIEAEARDMKSARPEDTLRLVSALREARGEEKALREAAEWAGCCLEGFAKIEVPAGASAGAWVAKTIYCNDMVTADQVLRAQSALIRLRAALSQNQPRADALADVAAERHRQIEVEGWTPEHDDEHGNGALADAAACYAISPAGRHRYEGALDGPKHWPPQVWPFDTEWWKPKDRRRDLVRAAALIVAEIERLDRSSLSPTGEEG